MKTRIIKVLQSHTGALLISGGICLKAGVIYSSLILAAPGYLILFLVIASQIEKWRDHDDHQN